MDFHLKKNLIWILCCLIMASAIILRITIDLPDIAEKLITIVVVLTLPVLTYTSFGNKKE